jgi:nucleotide-binding universal stress UspA family protein
MPGVVKEVIMTTKVLCPIDGTPHSLQALKAAADIATKFGAELSICLVNVAHGGGRGPLIHHWDDADAQKILDQAAASVKAQGVKVAHSAVVLDREAASGIVGYAEDKGIDHIVMGTGDKRGFSRLMLGSVAADVCARAHCTVTVAR